MTVQALKAVVENLDDIDEPLRGLYAESDKGGFRLQVTGVEFDDDVKALKNAHRQEKRLRENAERQLAKMPKDFDAQKWEEWVALHGEGGGNGDHDTKDDDKPEPKPKETNSDVVARVRKSLETRYLDEIKERDDRLATFEAKEKNRAIDDELGKAIDEIGITDPIYRKAVAALMKAQGVDAALENGDYKTVIKDELGEVRPIAVFMKEWAKTPEAEAFLPPSGATGGGGTGSARGGSTGSIRSKADFKARAEYLDYIEKHGKDKYLALPGKLPEGL